MQDNLFTYSNTNSKFSNTNSNINGNKCTPKNLEKFLNAKYNTENNKKSMYKIYEDEMEHDNKQKSKNNVIKKQSVVATINKARIDERNRFESFYETAMMKNHNIKKINDDKQRLEAEKGLKQRFGTPKINNVSNKKNEGVSEEFSIKNRFLVNEFKEK